MNLITVPQNSVVIEPELVIDPVEQIRPHYNMKETYQFISTADIVSRLESLGWHVEITSVASVRKADKRGFQKHMLRLRNPSYGRMMLNGDEVQPEIVIVNSHDGSTSTRIYLGIVRFACLNGLIAGTGFKDVRVIHSKNFSNKLVMGMEHVTQNIPELTSMISFLSSTQFQASELEELVQSTVDYKLRTIPNLVKAYYDTATQVRRYQDRKQDAWTVLNRLQESLIRGGISYDYKKFHTIQDSEGKTIKLDTYDVLTRATRKTSSIQQNILLNRFVFDKAMQVLK